MDAVEKLSKLKELLDSGVLTQEEFTAQKIAVLKGSAGIEPVQPAIVQPTTVTFCKIRIE